MSKHRLLKEKGKGLSGAALPDGHADLVRRLADSCDAAVAQAGLLVVTGGCPHIAELTQGRELDCAIAVSSHQVIIN